MGLWVGIYKNQYAFVRQLSLGRSLLSHMQRLMCEMKGAFDPSWILKSPPNSVASELKVMKTSLGGT